ncbi:ABC-type oligopeptide transport system, permease component [Leptotrichia trevisanii]|uniref:ABC-type oligopeptide transport system, permease component n=1 Tax=Leptotrichia trevisanii TaxID=109328 RepID=A0A510K2C9_9FUSO|nr:ABC transporter permease [Leptotrichia trevisanii]BBM43963.1 ABC-type oligopeptide transport system, permease component [Leptotrichia trevisanii]BBM51103.1 ABC-type oligopeptide transport system, permease component [Leptotrichia trevisanii]BBM56103.1 ABC-type oligopeptide transport system, permease component [Leptotrichia trevisanii]
MKNILKFLIKRIAMGLVTLWLVITITFFLIHMLPGDPFQSEKAIPPKVKENLMAKYHLDRPLGEQYVEYLKNIAKGDLGASMKVRGRTVNDVIKKSFLTSADLGARSIIFALALGIPLGIVAALKRGKYQDRLAMIVAIIGISVPSFVLAGLMQKYFVDIHNGILIDEYNLPLVRILLSGWDRPEKKILPVVALGLYTVALIARLLRDKMIEVMGQDYIRLAIAKGVKPKNIVFKHALRNAILPIITIMGPTIAAVLTGSFVIEKMFSIPGLGKYFVDSINDRDYTMVLGVTVFYAIFLIIMMILVDIVYVMVDPKIKLGKGDEI